MEKDKRLEDLDLDNLDTGLNIDDIEIDDFSNIDLELDFSNIDTNIDFSNIDIDPTEMLEEAITTLDDINLEMD